jgi:hypothetical protein
MPVRMTDEDRARLEAYRRMTPEQRAQVREALEKRWRDQPCSDPHRPTRWDMPDISRKRK